MADCRTTTKYTAGLSGKVLHKLIGRALDLMPAIPEWLDESVINKLMALGFAESFHRLHYPQEPADISTGAPPWQRLAFDELLAGQLALALVRQSQKNQQGRSVVGNGRIRERVLAAIPFKLTNSQVGALAEVEKDMAAPHRMLRLLQGDVGSGKTLVALMAAAIAIEAGSQACIMAPTEAVNIMM